MNTTLLCILHFITPISNSNFNSTTLKATADSVTGSYQLNQTLLFKVKTENLIEKQVNGNFSYFSLIENLTCAALNFYYMTMAERS